MGGVLMVIAIAVATLLWANLSNRFVWIALLASLWMAPSASSTTTCGS